MMFLSSVGVDVASYVGYVRGNVMLVKDLKGGKDVLSMHSQDQDQEDVVSRYRRKGEGDGDR